MLKILHNGQIIVIDYAVELYPSKNSTVTNIPAARSRYSSAKDIGQSDITTDVDISQLKVSPTSIEHN